MSEGKWTVVGPTLREVVYGVLIVRSWNRAARRASAATHDTCPCCGGDLNACKAYRA